jgi:drug/metabolite transporter (DMT)-like permease
VALASLLLLPFAGPQARRSWPALDARRRVLLIGAGLALALHFATWIASLSYTTVASSVLLVNTAPLFTVVLSQVFLHEKPSATVLAAIPLAVLGAALIAYGDWTGSPGSLLGNGLALFGAVMVAVYQVVGRGLREALPLDAYVLGVWGAAALALAALARGFGVPLAGYPAKTWTAFLALAVVPTLGGHGLVNKSLRSLPAPTVGLFLLGEPVIASLLAWILFHEIPGAWTLAGGAVVLAALGLVLARPA